MPRQARQAPRHTRRSQIQPTPTRLRPTGERPDRRRRRGLCVQSIISLLPRHSGKGEAENRPANWVRFGPKSAAMRLDDLAANGKAEPHAVALGRYERLEQAIRDFGSNAWTGVRNGNLDGCLVPYRHRPTELAAPP